MTKRYSSYLMLVTFLGVFIWSGVSMAAEKMLQFTDIRQLTVKGAFFDVTVTGHAGETVEASIKIPDRLVEKGVEVLHEQKAGDLRFWVAQERLFGLKLGFGNRGQMNFKVPHTLALDIANSSGEVRVEGITAPGVRLKASSGSIQARQITAKLTLHASSGDIRVDNCQGNKVVRTSSGRIEVLASKGNIEARSSSGSQEYSNIKGDIQASASSGDLRVNGHEGGLWLESTSGDQTGRNARLTAPVSFTTTSGDIDLDFVNPADELRFELESSSGKIKLGATSARGKVVTGHGEITVTGTSTSGDQIYR